MTHVRNGAEQIELLRFFGGRDPFDPVLGDDLLRPLLDFESCVDDWRIVCRWLGNKIRNGNRLHICLCDQVLMVSPVLSSDSLKCFRKIFWGEVVEVARAFTRRIFSSVLLFTGAGRIFELLDDLFLDFLDHL